MVQWICFHLPTHSSIGVYLTYGKLYIFESAQFAKLWYVYPCEAITTSKMVTTSSPRKFPVSLCKSSFYPTPPSSPGTQWPAFCHCRLVCIFSRLLYKWKHTECSIFFFWSGFFLLSRIILRFVHIFGCFRSSFLFIVQQYSMVRWCQTLLIQLPVDEHLGCLS